MIQQEIREKIKDAMRSKDEVRLSVLRGLIAAFTNEAVATGRKPDEPLSDDEALVVIKRAAKQRKDSIEQFREGGREDLASGESAELEIIESFLPAQMSKEEIEKIAIAKKSQLGIDDPTKKGQLIGAIIKETGGLADGNDVKEIVEGLF